MIDVIKELVSIESISDKQAGCFPYGEGTAKALDYLLKKAQGFGFSIKNADYRYGYAEIGEGEKLIAILAHLDTVPAGNGWEFPPFAGTEVNGVLYGRGVQDDKGPAVAALYAMKDLLDSGYPIKKRIRLILGQDEETGDNEDIKAYHQAEEMPDLGFTPDGAFPVVYGEKGLMIMGLSIPREKAGIDEIEGGRAINMVADFCRAVVDGEELTAVGHSAHGSLPWEGKNAISIMMDLLSRRDGAPYLAKAYMDLIGFSLHGEKMGLGYENSGEDGLSMNVGRIEMEKDQVVLYLDLRLPVDASAEDILEKIKRKVEPWGITAWSRFQLPSICTDKNSPMIQALLRAYRSEAEEETEPIMAPGSTYARHMDNIVAFGPYFPNLPCTEHEANESMAIKDLFRLRSIYRKALEELLKI